MHVKYSGWVENTETVCIYKGLRRTVSVCLCDHVGDPVTSALVALCPSVLQALVKGLFSNGHPEKHTQAHTLFSSIKDCTFHSHTASAPKKGEICGWGGGCLSYTHLKATNQKVNSSTRCGVTTSKESHYFYMNDNVQP